MPVPTFPQFKPITIEDRDRIHNILWSYQPQTSELTFTNLFIWRSHYGFEWCLYEDWLVILSTAGTGSPFLFQPIGPPPRLEITRRLLHWLENERGVKHPRMERADGRLVTEMRDAPDLRIEPTRDHFDYVYAREDLIQLAGRKYHSKRNHLNWFLQNYALQFVPLDERHRKGCLDVTETWCEWRRCADDMNLMNEWDAISQALAHYSELKLQGGVILIDGKVEAFAIGELLNDQTVVVHVEKANPHIRGLYAVVNQQFCENGRDGARYVNREQDLGEAGLRQAKLSYQPVHFVEKSRICLGECP